MIDLLSILTLILGLATFAVASDRYYRKVLSHGEYALFVLGVILVSTPSAWALTG